MTYEEALAWLRGERSRSNTIPYNPGEDWQVRVARADAATTEQAYWIAKAHREGLVGGGAFPPPMKSVERVLEPDTCGWQEDDSGEFWHTECGSDWMFESDGPKQNGVKYCHSCGRPVVIIIKTELT